MWRWLRWGDTGRWRSVCRLDEARESSLRLERFPRGIEVWKVSVLIMPERKR